MRNSEIHSLFALPEKSEPFYSAPVIGEKEKKVCSEKSRVSKLWGRLPESLSLFDYGKEKKEAKKLANKVRKVAGTGLLVALLSCAPFPKIP